MSKYIPVVVLWLVFIAAVYLAIMGLPMTLAGLASIACVLATDWYIKALRQEGNGDERQ